MSYEGYTQAICKNGHYFTQSSGSGYYTDEETCHVCQAKEAWFNGVDQTNGDDCGLIPVELLKRLFLLTPEVSERCNLGHVHITQHATFRIPTREETNPLQHINGHVKFKRIDGSYCDCSYCISHLISGQE